MCRVTPIEHSSKQARPAYLGDSWKGRHADEPSLVITRAPKLTESGVSELRRKFHERWDPASVEHDQEHRHRSRKRGDHLSKDILEFDDATPAKVGGWRRGGCPRSEKVSELPVLDLAADNHGINNSSIDGAACLV